MTGTRLRNRYIKSPSLLNKIAYKSQRNLCTHLLRKQKREYFDNLDTKHISNNKKFWKVVKPFLSEKVKSSQKMSLTNGNNIISDNLKILRFSMTFLFLQPQTWRSMLMMHTSQMRNT